RLAVGVGKTGRVTHESPGDGIWPLRVNRRNSIMSRERDNLIASCVEKRVNTRKQGANPLLRKICERRINLVLAACVHDMDLPPKRACSFLDIFQLCGAVRKGWIQQYSDESG